MVLSIALSVVLSILSIFFKRSRLVAILFFIFMWLMFGWNYWNGDYDMYETRYDHYISDLFLQNDDYEYGYKTLMILGNSLGLTFQQFFIAVSFVIMSLWVRTTFMLSKTPALFAFCFFLFFFPLDYVLLRNFLAFSIVVQGFISIYKNSKFKYIKYIAAVLIASTIHSSSIFYLLLLPAFLYPKILNVKKVALVAIIGLFAFIILDAFFIGIISENSDGRDEVYSSSITTFLIYSLFQIFNTYLIFYFYNTEKAAGFTQHGTSLSAKDDVRNSSTILLNVNIILLLLIILYYSFNVTIRLSRNIAILNLIYMANILYGRPQVKVKISHGVFLLIYLIWFYQHFIVPVDYYTIIPLFENNLLFN